MPDCLQVVDIHADLRDLIGSDTPCDQWKKPWHVDSLKLHFGGKLSYKHAGKRPDKLMLVGGVE